MGAKLYSYIAGTSTPLATYNSPSGTVPNTNPVILDASGAADIFLGARIYKLILADADDVEIYTKDDVDGTGAANATNPWAEHAVTDGQSATDLSGETVDGVSYSSATYDVEIIRGTTVFASGSFALQYLNGTWRLVLGPTLSEEEHGVTFSFSQSTSVAQLRASLDSGAGSGTIKLRRSLVPA